MTKREILLICGSHRSGTSALTGTLQHLGWRLPKKLMPGSRWNKKGYFESTVIRDFHDTVLDYLDRPVYDFRETEADEDFPDLLQTRRDQMSAILDSEFGRSKRIVIKDPRLCRLLPLWRAFAEEAGHAIYVILPIRSHDEVAKSLSRRNGFTLPEGLLIWMRELALAETQSRGMPRSIIRFSDLLADWRSTLDGAMTELGLEVFDPDLKDVSKIEEFLSPALAAKTKAVAPSSADPWPRELAHRMFTAIRTDRNGDGLDACFAALNTAIRLMGDANRPGRRACRAISAISPAMEILLEASDRAQPFDAASRQPAPDEVADMTSRLETAENDLVLARTRIQDLEELSESLEAENEELRLSLKDRFAEIAGMVDHQESTIAEKDEINRKLRKTDKSYKELKAKFDKTETNAADLEARLAELKKGTSPA